MKRSATAVSSSGGFGLSRACTICKRDHKACDGGRPCSRCVNAGLSSLCGDVHLKKRGPRKKANTQLVWGDNRLTCSFHSFHKPGLPGPTTSPVSPSTSSSVSPISGENGDIKTELPAAVPIISEQHYHTHIDNITNNSNNGNDNTAAENISLRFKRLQERLQEMRRGPQPPDPPAFTMSRLPATPASRRTATNSSPSSSASSSPPMMAYTPSTTTTPTSKSPEPEAAATHTAVAASADPAAADPAPSVNFERAVKDLQRRQTAGLYHHYQHNHNFLLHRHRQPPEEQLNGYQASGLRYQASPMPPLSEPAQPVTYCQEQNEDLQTQQPLYEQTPINYGTWHRRDSRAVDPVAGGGRERTGFVNPYFASYLEFVEELADADGDARHTPVRGVTSIRINLMEDALVRRHLASIMEQPHKPFVLLDMILIPDNLVRYLFRPVVANDRMCNLLGLTHEEMLNVTDRTVVPLHNPSNLRARRHLESFAESRPNPVNAVCHLSLQLLSKLGGEIDIFARHQVFYTASNEPTMTLVVIEHAVLSSDDSGSGNSTNRFTEIETSSPHSSPPSAANPYLYTGQV